VLLRCRQVASPLRHAEPAGTVWLQFTVSDTGAGMSAETMEKVFEPFAQAAASTDREYGGSGARHHRAGDDRATARISRTAVTPRCPARRGRAAKNALMLLKLDRRFPG